MFLKQKSLLSLLSLVLLSAIGFSGCIGVDVGVDELCYNEPISFPGLDGLKDQWPAGIAFPEKPYPPFIEAVASFGFNRDYSASIPNYSEDDLNSDHINGSVKFDVNSMILSIVDGIVDLNQIQKINIQISGSGKNNSDLEAITLIDFVNPDYGSSNPKKVKAKLSFEVLPSPETLLKYFRSGELRFNIFASGKVPTSPWNLNLETCISIDAEAKISL